MNNGMEQMQSPLKTAFAAATLFERQVPRHIYGASEVYVDPAVDGAGDPVLVVHAEEDMVEDIAASMGSAVAVARTVGGRLLIQDVAVEYRPFQPTIEIR